MFVKTKQNIQFTVALFIAAVLFISSIGNAVFADSADSTQADAQFAKQYSGWKQDVIEESVTYPDSLAWQYARPYLEAAPDDQPAIHYSDALPLLYAKQYGNWTPQRTAKNNIQVDVAEAGTRFVFDDAPVFEDGMPAYGNSFVTEGYLYSAGTLNESNGVLPNGDPEFPELVLGRWTCRGWFIGDGAYTTTGPWVVTTQIYDFGDEVGAEMIITEGFELSDVGVAGERAITGGTGAYERARGSMSQTLLGFNESMGVNLQVTLDPTH